MKEKLKRILTDPRTLFWVWMIITVTGMTRYGHGRENNYLIFKQVFWHVIHQLPLFVHYPAEYFDLNHYGPVFSLVIAPFAVLPTWTGMLLWLVALTLLLFFAVRRNVFTEYQQIFIYWFCAHELLNGVQMQQFNIAIAAIILISYCCIEKEKDFWAAFAIMLGTFVKLYGIVGLAFFFFSRHKGKFVLSLLFWAIIMFVAPMIISSPEYIIGQYHDWYVELVQKNSDNMFSQGTNISLLGLVRKISGCATYSDLWLIIPGMIAFALPYLRIGQYPNQAFRQTILASTLMFVVLFSTGSENSGYITPVIGVVIWYTAAPWERSKWDIALMVYVFIFCTMAHSDFMPRYIRDEWMRPYGLKALPVVIVWLKLCYEMYTKDYRKQ
ncbi:MAG: DUF2029 domain-containing protein [Bacteroidaceae bacterium]|nr:DUF2029 domain-containing protein [Bacteroidaceae bacterium]